MERMENEHEISAVGITKNHDAADQGEVNIHEKMRKEATQNRMTINRFRTKRDT